MLKYSSLVLLAISLASQFGCKEEEAPIPEAIFVAEFTGKATPNTGIPYIADYLDTIWFVNRSVSAVKYEWDFGDGTFSDEEAPFHLYEKPGDYVATLKAYNRDGKFTTSMKDVFIGVRYFNEIWLNKTSVDIEGRAFFYFGQKDSLANSHFAVFPPSVTNQNLPWGGALNLGAISSKLVFANKDWFWTLIKNNEPLNYFDENDELIFQVELNPLMKRAQEIKDLQGYIVIDSTYNGQGALVTDHEFKIGFNLLRKNR